MPGSMLFSYFYTLRNWRYFVIEVITFLIVGHKFSFNIISNHDSLNFIMWWNVVINFLEIFDVNSGLHFVLPFFRTKHEPISQLYTHARLWQSNSFQKHISEIELHLIRYTRIKEFNVIFVNEPQNTFPLTIASKSTHRVWRCSLYISETSLSPSRLMFITTIPAIVTLEWTL